MPAPSYRKYVQDALASVMDAGEARSVMLLMFERRFGMSVSDVLMGKPDSLSPEERSEMDGLVERVVGGEPVQYVLGGCEFCGMDLTVGPGVLIPRPETSELVGWCAGLYPQDSHLKILDIGTGSGCIALALKRLFPMSEVAGWDLSADALSLARRNASRLSLDVVFERHDILNIESETDLQPSAYDLIVSNPPYVCESEQTEMERNVLDYEPHLALFVPDSDPLLFYRSIAAFAVKTLKRGGSLFFEINRKYGAEVSGLLRSNGFSSVEVRKDQFGNDRMVRGLLE